jgi:hypothetical protein
MGSKTRAPSAKLRKLIRNLGLLQTIVVVPARSRRFRVVEGRRRCNAITQLTEAREWSMPAAPKTVQSPRARGGEVARLSARAALVRVLASFVFLA